MTAPILRINPDVPETDLIRQAVDVLVAGKILILPTDTVYGIGLMVSVSTLPDAIFASKERPVDKSIPLLVAGLDSLTHYGLNLPDYALELAVEFWPGALTLVVQATEAVPGQFTSADGSVALRMPDHAITLALLEACRAPLACSSANLSGEAPAINIDELNDVLAQRVDLIIDGGALSGGVASTVVSCLQSEPQVLRPGPIEI